MKALSKIKQVFLLLKQKNGQATVEYALILVIIVLVVIAGLSNISEALVNFLNAFTSTIPR